MSNTAGYLREKASFADELGYGDHARILEYAADSIATLEARIATLEAQLAEEVDAVAEREPVVAAWQFKHYDPISGHPVWKTTLYWNGHRATEYRPLYLDPPPTSELEALRKRVAELEKAMEWYEDKVADCRKLTKEGDSARADLDRDGGKLARRVREGGKVE